MAKRNNKRNSSGILQTLSRALGSIWRTIAKALGASIRLLTRGARDLDAEHQRDGIGLSLLIVSLLAAATSWWKLDNWFGHVSYSFFYGAVGRLAIFTPILFGYFAFRFFRAPQDKAANGRLIIGSFLLVVSATGLVHIINPSSITNPTATFTHGSSPGVYGTWINYVYQSSRAYNQQE